jgi:hypothetical protein
MSVITTNQFWNQAKTTDLARMHLWTVVLPNRTGPEAEFYCKSATWPSKKIGEIKAPFLGFDYKLPNTAKFDEPWTVRVRSDMGNEIRQRFSEWADSIYDWNSGIGVTFDELEDAELVLLDTKLERTTKIRMEGMFPTNVGQIQYVYESNDSLVEFDVTFAFQGWNIVE